jgi:hypothetical protein
MLWRVPGQVKLGFPVTRQCVTNSLQLGVLRLGLLQDGDVGVGVFPEREEILVLTLRPGSVARHRVGTTELKTGSAPVTKFTTMPRWGAIFPPDSL